MVAAMQSSEGSQTATKPSYHSHSFARSVPGRKGFAVASVYVHTEKCTRQLVVAAEGASAWKPAHKQTPNQQDVMENGCVQFRRREDCLSMVLVHGSKRF